MHDSFKFLVGAAAIAFIAQAGSQVWRDAMAVQVFMIEKDAVAIDAARMALQQERIIVAQRMQSRCEYMRGLGRRYARGGRQQPGMESWNEARLFVEKNCGVI